MSFKRTGLLCFARNDVVKRILARQFARPSGWIGRWFIAPWLNRIGRRLNALAFDLLAPHEGEALLEVGYGGGGLVRRLARERLARLAAVDVSKAVPRHIPGAELIWASATALPFADESFDGAVSVSVLHFWPELDTPLTEIARVLKRGGRLVLVFEPPEALRRWKGSTHGFEMWTVKDVVRAARRAGMLLEARAEGQGRKPDYFVGLRFRKGAA